MNLIWAADRLINRCYCTPVCASYSTSPALVPVPEIDAVFDATAFIAERRRVLDGE